MIRRNGSCALVAKGSYKAKTSKRKNRIPLIADPACPQHFSTNLVPKRNCLRLVVSDQQLCVQIIYHSVSNLRAQPPHSQAHHLRHLPPPTAAEPLEPWSPWREPRKWWPCASRGTPSASWAKTCCVAVRSAKTKLSWMLSILGELFL